MIIPGVFDDGQNFKSKFFKSHFDHKSSFSYHDLGLVRVY